MKYLRFWPLALLALALVPALARADDAAPFISGDAARLPLFKAYTQGKVVYYTTFEASDPSIIRRIDGTFAAPRLAKARDEGTDDFFNVTNGVRGQEPVMGSPPGDPDYSPIWRLVQVSWKRSARKKLLTSEADVNAQAANLTTQVTSIRFNCPVLLVSDDLRATHLRPAPTINLGAQLISWGVKPGASRGAALYRIETAWHDGRAFAFLDLEAGPNGLDPIQPVVATVPKLSLNVIATSPASPHDPVAEFYVVEFQNRVVIDSVPEAEDRDIYSPLWHVSIVLFNPGVQPRELHDEAEIEAAELAGDVTIFPQDADAVFNCPVVDARDVVALPLASNEVRFLERVSLLSHADAARLQADIGRKDDAKYESDVNALVDASTITSELGHLLLELERR